MPAQPWKSGASAPRKPRPHNLVIPNRAPSPVRNLLSRPFPSIKLAPGKPRLQPHPPPALARNSPRVAQRFSAAIKATSIRASAPEGRHSELPPQTPQPKLRHKCHATENPPQTPVQPKLRHRRPHNRTPATDARTTVEERRFSAALSPAPITLSFRTGRQAR
jgi:hypothetical protein